MTVSEFEEYPHFFEVQVDLFKGPIDLLLHLVKQKELPLEEISLAEVADQYMHCLEQMRRFDLEIAGEYLVIAATLLSIKSSHLLNEPVELVEDDEGNLVDPHEELLMRLREAEVFKKGAEQLDSRGFLNIDVFAPESSLKQYKSPKVKYKDHDPMLLGLALRKVLEEAGEQGGQEYKITLESVSIVDRMMSVLDALRSSDGPKSFRSLIPDLSSRGEIIGTFVSLLELCKRQVIKVMQEEESGEIVVGLSGDESSFDLVGMKLESEFDEEEAQEKVVGE